LDNVEAKGVIEKITRSDWAALTVAVPKGDDLRRSQGVSFSKYQTKLSPRYFKHVVVAMFACAIRGVCFSFLKIRFKESTFCT